MIRDGTGRHRMKGRWCATAALVVQLSFAISVPGAPAVPKSWQRWTARIPQPGTIELKIDGQVIGLQSGLDRVAEHFRHRAPDSFLAEQIASALDDEKAARGVELERGQLEFDRFPPAPFSGDPTWAENPFDDPNWQWALHNFTIMRYLLAAHEKTGSDEYLSRAEALLKDWMQDNFQPTPPSRFSWHDHATALRLQNLLYFLEYARQQGISRGGMKSLLEAIWAHASVLRDPAFYVKHTNHGLDQSYILYLAGAANPEFADAAHWREVGRSRTMDELSFAFTPEGVHVENSPSYHMVLLRRTVLINSIFEHFEGDNIGAGLPALLDGAFRFAAYVVKPDGTLPRVGDSESLRVRDDPSFAVAGQLRGYREFKYSVTDGREGLAPEAPMRAFSKSGYVVLRDTWDARNFEKSFYLLFKSAYLSAYHRHDDDLSFVMSYMGEDWIIDSGLYSYDEKDPFRQYVRDARAYNVVVVDDLAQPRGWKNLGKSRIDGFSTNGLGAEIRASHSLYPNMKVSRTLLCQPPDFIRVTDRVLPADGEKHTYRVLFHVPGDKTVTVSEREAAVRSTETNVVLRLALTGGSVSRVYAVTGQVEPDTRVGLRPGPARGRSRPVSALRAPGRSGSPPSN